MVDKKSHGGKREGSGRKPGSNIYGEKTMRIRIPFSLKPIVDDLLLAAIKSRSEIPSNIDLLGIPSITKSLSRPLFGHAVPAGFPSPADDYIEKNLDLNEYVDASNPALFYCRVVGDSMIGAGILDGDIIAVDKSMTANNNDVVVAVVNNELTVKRLSKKGKQIALHPENVDFPIIEISGEMELIIWGVVTNVIRKIRKS